MRALVVYESMYGNTRVIAGDIADGLRADYEVTVVPWPGHRRACRRSRPARGRRPDPHARAA